MRVQVKILYCQFNAFCVGETKETETCQFYTCQNVFGESANVAISNANRRFNTFTLNGGLQMEVTSIRSGDIDLIITYHLSYFDLFRFR